MKIQNYYKLLGLSGTSTCEELYEECRKLFIKYHPQNNKTMEAVRRFIIVNDAYAVLLNEEIRKDYDIVLSGFSEVKELENIDKEIVQRIEYLILEKRKTIREILIEKNPSYGSILDNEPMVVYKYYGSKVSGYDEGSSLSDLDIDLNPFD